MRRDEDKLLPSNALVSLSISSPVDAAGLLNAVKDGRERARVSEVGRAGTRLPAAAEPH